jgi:plastocyanin
MLSGLALGSLAFTVFIGAARHNAPSVVVVNMVLNSQGMRYVPREIVINRGDVVKFVNVSGGLHNVAFDGATIPVTAKASLAAAMPIQLGPLMSPMIVTANGSYTMTFANIPSGKYPFFCSPHRHMGMTGVITVR